MPPATPDKSPARAALMPIVVAIFSFLQIVILGLSTWVLTSMIDVRERLTAIESNRFTSRDGVEVWKEIARIREEMATLPRETPPPWFLEEFRALEYKVDQLQESLHDISVEVRRFNGKGVNHDTNPSGSNSMRAVLWSHPRIVHER